MASADRYAAKARWLIDFSASTSFNPVGNHRVKAAI
jgi:hypothetical protein